MDHAARHLIDQGVITGVAKSSKAARSAFRELATDILENPTSTFDHTLRGGLKTKVFVKTVNGQRVGVHVAKHAQGKVRQGDVVTSFVLPD